MGIIYGNMSEEINGNKRLMYLLAKSPEAVMVKDIEDGSIINVSGFMFYTKQEEGKDDVDLLSLLDSDGNIFTCQSNTFMDEIMDIFNTFVMQTKDGSPVYEFSEPLQIKKLSGITKAGRDFVTCTIP